MDAQCAAFFVGEGLSGFLAGVEAGKYPKPDMVRSRKRWLTSALMAAVDTRDDPKQPSGPETDEDWLGELDRADANPRH
jgi:hypothetical protein